MKRYLLLLSLFCLREADAQAIFWITDCSNKNFCLNNGSCTQGEVLMVEKASTFCASQNINYSYRIDLNNDGSQEISSSEDTVRGNFVKGTHKIIWKATDNCGNLTQCTYLFTIKDCTPPNMLCISGLTQTLDPPACDISFNTSQFVLSSSDNCTPTNQLEYGMRILGSGTGFPTETSITFGKCDHGFNSLEIWVRDGNGLTNQCNSYVIVQNSDPVCECNEDADLGFEACARASNGPRLSAYRLYATVQSVPGATVPFSKVKTVSSTDSCFSVVVNKIPFGADYQAVIRADKPDVALNGVTTFDLVLISKHILGIEPLTTAYQFEAADVNNSNTVTTSDIVETRKIILGITDTFTQVPSWRLSRPLPNPSDINSFTALKDTYMIELPNLQADLNFQGFNFVGIKYADVNNSASLNGEPDDRSNPEPLYVNVRDRELRAGETAEINIALDANTPLDGWQLVFQSDPEALELLSVSGLPENDYRLTRHSLRAIRYDQAALENITSFRLRVKALRPLRLSNALTLNPSPLKPEAYYSNAAGKAMRRPMWLRYDGNHNELLSVTPNPFRDMLDFNLKLEAPSPALLEIYSTDGRRVFSSDYDLDGGQQIIRINGTSLPAEKMMLYRIRLGNDVFSGKISKL